MKKLISVMLVLMLAISLYVPVFAIREQSDGTNTQTDSKTIFENEIELKRMSDGEVESAKNVVEEYLRVNMKKYDPSSKDELSYDHIIRENNPFKEYAEKLLILINYRYRVYDSLALNAVNYKIEYGTVSNSNGILTIHVSVLEELDYKNQIDFGYILTKHIITVEKDNGHFYIKEDITDDYIDRYFRENADKEKCTIDDLIELDKQTIGSELGLNCDEMKAYLQNKEMNTCSRIPINQVDSFQKTQGDNNDARKIEITIPIDGSVDTEKYINENRDVQHYNFNINNMYTYASHYNAASPVKIYDRNPQYVNYDNNGGDCTNYISQILRAGGAPNDNTGSYKWYYFSGNNRSASWTSVNYLYNYLVNNTYIGPQGNDITNNGSYYNASKGDLIQLKFSIDGSYIHSLWITAHQQGTTSLTTIACHTSDKWNYPLDSIVGIRRWIKLTGYDQ